MSENSVKQTGYLTPDDIPEERICRSFSIPRATAWLGVFMGALAPLLDAKSWRQFGALTPDECAAEALNIFFSFQTACDAAVPTPYWDEDEDLDDEAAPAAQVWYGTVEDPSEAPDETTFEENAAIWSFAGMLAIAGATPAALAFLTIAPKFVVAIRQGNYGKIVRLFVDGEKVNEVTDAGDGSVLEMSVIADPAAAEHQIYITVGDE